RVGAWHAWLPVVGELAIKVIDGLRRPVAETILGVEGGRSGARVREARNRICAKPVRDIRRDFSRLVGAARRGKGKPGNIVLEQITTVSLLHQPGLTAVLFVRLDIGFRQGPGVRLANVNLDVVRHLPETGALP